MDRSRVVLSSRFFVVTLCLVCLGTALVGCSGRRSEQHSGQGDIYLRQGNIEKAESNYRQAIELNSENARAHFGLGRTLSLSDKPEEALESFDRVIGIDPTLVEAYERAAELHLANDDVPGAVGRAQALAGVNEEAGTLLHALMLQEANQAEEAIALLRALLEGGEGSSRVRTSLAVSYLRAERGADAEVELKGLLDGPEADSFPLHVLLMEAYRLQGKHGEMLQGLRDLAAERPNSEEAQVRLALGLLESGNVAEASAIATPLVEQSPESDPANYILGSCLIAQGDFANAVRHLQVAQQAYPSNQAVTERLALARSGGSLSTATPTPDQLEGLTPATGWRALWDNGSFQELLDSRDSLVVSEAEAALYREILALTALFTDDYALATELGGMLGSESPVLRYIQSIQPLFEKRVDQESAEEIQNALATWETGEDEGQGVMKANVQGYVLARLGFRAQAYKYLSNALRQWPGNGVAWRNLASMYRLANMPKYRVASLRQLLATKGNNPEALRLLFTALLDSGMEREAQTFAESTYALMPNDPEAIANLAQAYLRADMIPLAIQVLEQAVANQPEKAILAVTLGVARLRAGDAQGALDALDGAGSDPDWTLATMELGAFAEAHMGNWDRTLNKIGSVADDSLSLKISLLKVAALLHMDESADAVSALPAGDMLPGANLHNKVAESVFVLGHALGEEADLTDATAVRLGEGLREGPSGTKLFAYGLALQEAQLYEHAYNAFNELYATMEDQPRLITFVFDSLSKSGTLDDRPSTAEALAAAHDDWLESLLGLAKVYGAESDTASQQDALVQATALAPDNTEAWQILAEFAGRQGDEALSLVAYEHLLDLEPDSAIILNNLAYYILKMEGDAQVALEYASKANELMGGVSAFMHTLGLAQLRVGDLESSQANLTQALTMQPGDPTLTLDFGQLLIKLGRVDEGKRAVQSALDYAKALDVEFPRSAEAEKILAEE